MTTTKTWPTRFAVLLVAVLVTFTISACGGSNPGGPDPLSSPSPSPTPAGNWVRMDGANPTSGSTVRYEHFVDIAISYNIEGTYSDPVKVEACFSVDGQTVPNGTWCHSRPTSSSSGGATARPGMYKSEAQRLGIMRTDYIVVRMYLDKPDPIGRAGENDEVLTQASYNVVYNFVD